MAIRVKFCGMTNAIDAKFAAELGVDAIGLIFYEPSPRHVTLTQAQQIIRVLPPFIMTVGVFVDASPQYITRVLQHIPLNLLQFHGNESPIDCELYHRPYIKALRVDNNMLVEQAIAKYPNASGFLLDSYQPNQAGGTGKMFAWDKVPKRAAKPIILAGGLTAANVGNAIRQVQPYAVDVVSGIEATKGYKDPDKMVAFIKQVRSVNS